MDTQNYVEYECIDSVSNRRILTESREEAVAYFEKNWMVYESHHTITVPSPFVSTKETVTLRWNDNPYFEV